MIDTSNLTPAMKQFAEIKTEHPDCVLFFRMGDFYEMFYNDAKVAADVLGITLTKRGNAPLAGIPWHTLEPNLAKMIEAGKKVAICEQLEDPRKVKGRVVKRGVTRIVTPGTVISPIMLEEKSNNFIMSVSNNKDSYGIAVCDLSTGEFITSDLGNINEVMLEIGRFEPKELIVQEDINLKLPVNSNIFKTSYDNIYYSASSSYKELTRHFNTLNLEGFGIEDRPAAIKASGALLTYLRETQKGHIKQITNLHLFSTSDHMLLDSTTIKNLELFQNIRDNTKRGSLLETIDATTTAMGGRLLKRWIQKPLISKDKINNRLNSVEELKEKTLQREQVKKYLSQVSDIERLIARISNRSALPRDLVALKESLKVIPLIKEELAPFNSEILSTIKEMNHLPEIVELISKSVKDEPSNKVREGNIIKQNYNEELDSLREISHGGKDFISKLEASEKEKTNIPTLKVGFNRVHGYYIEVTKQHHNKVPDNYIRRQTLTNAERYITPELKEYEEKILNAEEKINDLEYDLFMKILEGIETLLTQVQNLANNIAILDVLTGFSTIAANYGYSKPQVTEEYELDIRDGKHPVVEQIHPEPFVPNDTKLNMDNRMMIITGPNMAGKSTYMRQVALIQLLTQIGSFVPASFANIGVVDRIFTRIGAYDDLTMGQSTFMVEMNETSNILNNATYKSLVILDEIGRGTSTFDGVALAWSIAIHIYENLQAKTLFATHYHQMNKLSEKYQGIKNCNIAVKQIQDDLIFLRKILDGGTNKSYGVQVAKLAGLPDEVIQNSLKIMEKLEQQDQIARKIHIKSSEDKNLDAFF